MPTTKKNNLLEYKGLSLIHISAERPNRKRRTHRQLCRPAGTVVCGAAAAGIRAAGRA